MSYTDPEILYRKLAAGDPGRVHAAADPITAAMSALDRARASIDQGSTTAAADWRGDAADAFARRAALSSTAVAAAHSRLAGAVRTLQAVAGAYTQMLESADLMIAPWRRRRSDLDEAAVALLADKVNSRLRGVRGGYEHTLRGYVDLLRGITPGFAEMATSDQAWQQTAPQAGLTLPQPGTDPVDVARWWAGLTETQRDQLRATEFDALGRLRGLPADVLDDANRRRIETDQQRYRGQTSELDAQIAARAAELGLDPTDEGALRESNDNQLADLLDQRNEIDNQLDNADAAHDRMTEADQLAQDKDITDGAYVLAYDADGPGHDGALAVAFGNPDTADNVAVVVPGTGTSVSSSFPSGSAAELLQQMNEADPDSANATIAWLGYDAPDSITSTDVAKSGQAIDGAANLIADVDGYRAAAGNTQHITVIGHSYGSTTVGYAGMDGLAADDIAFIGSPGVGASNADQLSPGSGHVWAGAAEHDPVVQATQGTWFTADGTDVGPYSDEFDAHVFGTPDGGSQAGAHSGYYDPGSGSLENLGNIATGNYDDVSDQSWRDDPLAGNASQAADGVIDFGEGVIDVGGNLIEGDLGGALDGALSTGGEVLSDVGDVVTNTVGGTVETGRDVWDATVGALPWP